MEKGKIRNVILERIRLRKNTVFWNFHYYFKQRFARSLTPCSHPGLRAALTLHQAGLFSTAFTLATSSSRNAFLPTSTWSLLLLQFFAQTSLQTSPPWTTLKKMAPPPPPWHFLPSSLLSFFSISPLECKFHEGMDLPISFPALEWCLVYITDLIILLNDWTNFNAVQAFYPLDCEKELTKGLFSSTFPH